MQCPRCKIDMQPGVAIEPNEPKGILYVRFEKRTITAENLKMINCLKCPQCGHSDDLK